MRHALSPILVGAIMALSANGLQGRDSPPGTGYPTETYRQEVTVELADDAAATDAQVAIAPLYGGKSWAAASRWDDNGPRQGQVRMARTLARQGYQATWYRNHEDAAEETIAHLRALRDDGNSFGGHSLTHPWLPYQSRTRIFEEVAAVRAQIEAMTDSPVNSFALPFLASRGVEGQAIHRDITTCLARAGYFHLPSRWFNNRIRSEMITLPYLPPDGADIAEYADKALADPAFAEQYRGFAFAMHVWYRTDEQWDRFEEQLKRYGGRADWWYCNQNQYAAYRWQRAHAQVEDVRREGKLLRFSVIRNLPVDLNDEIPLTLEVGDIDASAIVSAACDTAAIGPVESNDGVARLHLHHDRDRRLPTRIGHIRNPDNRPAAEENADTDPDFPAVRAWLHFDGRALLLALSNASDQPLSGVRVTYRLGPGWKGGVVRRRLGDLPSGSPNRDVLELTRQTDDPLYFAGVSYFVGQVDFRAGSEAGRLHVDCRADLGSEDPSYPQGRFLRAGPLAPEALDLDALVAECRRGPITERPWRPAEGPETPWVRDEGPRAGPFLGPEIVRTTGDWYARDLPDCRYLLASTVHSPKDRPIALLAEKDTVAAVLLNGELLSDRRGTLRQGDNALVLVYRSPRQKVHGERAGCFVRLMDPGPRQRLTDIRYEPK